MFFITAEIYNETVIDLLIPNARLPNLREDSLKGRILVEGAFEPKVESLKEVVHLLGPITNLFAWGEWRSVWNPENFASVPHGQPESGGIVLAVVCWAPSAQRRCYPTGRCTYRPSVTS